MPSNSTVDNICPFEPCLTGTMVWEQRGTKATDNRRVIWTAASIGVVIEVSAWHDSANSHCWKEFHSRKYAKVRSNAKVLSIENLEVEGKVTTRKDKRPVKSYVFRVVVDEDTTVSGQEAYHAYCPALKGCHTWGRTYDEAFANVREAIELYIEDLREAGEPVPLDPEGGAFEWPTPAVAVNV